MPVENYKIDWSYPAPRAGFKGFVDKLIGPGATKAELWLQFSFAIGLGLVGLLVGVFFTSWNIWQIVVVSYLLFDIGGGIATNATSSAKRWWHRLGRRTFKNDATFVVLHFYMPLLITLVFFPTEWLFFFTAYGYLILAFLVISRFPQYLRRPVTLMTYTFGLFIPLFIKIPSDLLWFLPMFYLKLLVSHLLLEEPYRPENE